MSRTSGGRKGTPPAQAVLGHLTQRGTLSDSLRRGTTFGRGPGGLLVQILTADKAEIDPQVPNRQSQLPAGSRGLGTPCQGK